MPTHPLPNDFCPRCRATNLRAGTITAQGDGHGAVFQPSDMKLWSFSFSGGVPFENVARACLDCGLIWTEADRKELADFVAKKCKPVAKPA